jgi:CDP-paratose 2-epimerase
MSIAIVTGSAGLVGAETVRLLAAEGLEIIGIDNDMRAVFFGPGASTAAAGRELQRTVKAYRHVAADIRSMEAIEPLFAEHAGSIAAIVHTAGQPSHDWAARDPHMDFSVNANGTLNLLELTRRHCPEVPFVFTSTNKVYGDTPNRLPLVERESRWELDPAHPWAEHGIDEGMSIDSCLHSLFGASKVAADVLVQEYGRYFGMKTASFRCGCITGPDHAGAKLHGFLAYLARCAVSGEPYTVLGYKGKQVRDNIHAADLAAAFLHFIRAPRSGEVYNMGGSRYSNCSMLEAIRACERLTGRPMNWSYAEDNRIGDHIWWISDVRRFQSHYPDWRYRYDLDSLLGEIVEAAAAQRPAA